jgi:thioredoxin reductase
MMNFMAFCLSTPLMKTFDVIIVGAGPAGLSAALILGRCRRNVLIFNSGIYRNASSYAMFGYLSRDGISPRQFLNISRRQLKKYSNVKFKDKKVTNISKHRKVFEVFMEDGQSFFTQKLILATGIKDQIPSLPGILNFFGKTVFLCPYCDGWEFKDKPIAAYGKGQRGPKFALLLKTWSSDVVLCSDGPLQIAHSQRKKLKEARIPVFEEPIARLEGRGQRLKKIVFESGKSILRTGLFFNTPIEPCSELAEILGCRRNKKGEILVDNACQSSVDGVYVAGDASPDIKLAIVAAAEGTKAAYAVHKDLLQEKGLI